MRWFGALAIAGICAACGSNSPGTAPADGATGAADSAAAPAASTPAGSDVGPAPAAAPPAPAFREVTLPAGTALRLDLTSSVGSDTSRVEDAVQASLREAVTVDGRDVLPAGIELAGTVTDVEQSGRVKGRARVAYRFHSLNLAGERYDVATAPLVHEAEPTKQEDATKIAIGAGAGAAIGAILGGGDGAAKGAAIGGGAGAGTVLATRGKEIRLGPGADVTTRLTAPLTVRTRM